MNTPVISDAIKIQEASGDIFLPFPLERVVAQVFAQVGLGLVEPHHSVILVASGANKGVIPEVSVAVNTKHNLSFPYLLIP